MLPFSEDKVMHGISTCFKSVIENQPLSMTELVQLARKSVGGELLKALESSLCYKGSSSFTGADHLLALLQPDGVFLGSVVN